MSAAQLKALLKERATLVPLTLEQYHRMVETGILSSGEPIELLDGYLVRKDRSAVGADPMTVGPAHSWALSQIEALLAGLEPRGCHFRSQRPLTISPDSEPEPDGAIVRGSRGEYRNRHPAPGDVYCVIEVADCSLQRDRTTKHRIYADAGIPQYVIVNLLENVIEEYRQPVQGMGRYGQITVHRKGAILKLDLPEAGGFELPTGQVLP